MKVKIGNTIYDSQEVPILVILDDQEIRHMQDMPSNTHLYCSFPDDSKDEDITEFMNVEVSGFLQY
ncbi:MAG TPA: hypothetical protein VIK72_16985 [Clostridiaceae bacterium]